MSDTKYYMPAAFNVVAYPAAVGMAELVSIDFSAPLWEVNIALDPQQVSALITMLQDAQESLK